MRLLISWLAYNNDFAEGKANKSGPTYLYHEYFFEQDRHIILYTSEKEETRATHLLTLLKKNFPEREIESMCLNISDVIDVNEIKTKVESLLLKNEKHQIDLFISPGTPAMQVSWYLCHMNLGINTTLYQTRAGKFTKGGSKPDLIKVEVDKSSFPISAILHQTNINDEESNEDYKITDSIKYIYDSANKIAQTDDVTTLILGESGSGKEHLSRFIHDNSIRKDRTYVTLNCSAFSDQLLESRLFGYKKGTFTGADKDTPGLFEEANKGTIFLDEIGDISPYMQQSLLRVLQSKEIMPIGGKSIKVDVRIIAATNRNLPQMCEEGKFRWDLYYRLSVVELELPALLKRGKKDLKELIDFFITKKKKQLHKAKKIQFSKGALDVLLDYSYPGNVRELENIIARLYIYNDEKVGENDLPEKLVQKSVDQPLNWEYIEKEHIKKVLAMKNGNQRQTALAIGWSLNTLKSKIKEYEIDIN